MGSEKKKSATGIDMPFRLGLWRRVALFSIVVADRCEYIHHYDDEIKVSEEKQIEKVPAVTVVPLLAGGGYVHPGVVVSAHGTRGGVCKEGHMVVVSAIPWARLDMANCGTCTVRELMTFISRHVALPV